jgi:ABC-type phosphate/phosphonate transport system ATPase subunit
MASIALIGSGGAGKTTLYRMLERSALSPFKSEGFVLG